MDSRANKFITSVLKYEGGYVNDPNDLGGETYRGISRKSFPSWSGWTTIDQNKPLKTNQIISSTSLENLVKDFYYKNFYLKMSIDKINNTVLAMHTFDHGVNAGIKNGVKVLQRAINKVTNAGIAVDGIIGSQTLGLANGDKAEEIAKEITNQRKTYYRNIVSSRPANSKYLNGWLKRVDNVNTTYGSTLSSTITAVILDNKTSETTQEKEVEEKKGIGKVLNGTMISKATGFLSALADFFYSLAGLKNR